MSKPIGRIPRPQLPPPSPPRSPCLGSSLGPPRPRPEERRRPDGHSRVGDLGPEAGSRGPGRAVTEGRPGRSRAAPGGGVAGADSGGPGGERRQRSGSGPVSGRLYRRQARPPGSTAARDPAALAGRGAPQAAGPGGRGGAGRLWARGARIAETRAGERSRAPGRSASGSAGNELRLRGPDGGGRRRNGASARVSGSVRSGRRGARGAGRGWAAACSRVSR